MQYILSEVGTELLNGIYINIKIQSVKVTLCF
jgi:hypothetical protein